MLLLLLTGVVNLAGSLSVHQIEKRAPAQLIELTLNTKLSPTSGVTENDLWNNFRLLYKKVYESVLEENRRKNNFLKTQAKVDQLNEDYISGKVAYFMKMNEFGDLSKQEYRKRNGYGKTRKGKSKYPPVPSSYIAPADFSCLPKSVDWRQKGAVSGVKTQRGCGGCFAFSATDAIEGHHFRKTGELVELSPQNLIDCTNTNDYGNDGCSGGYIHNSFEYVKNNPGISRNSVYAFEEKAGPCRFDHNKTGAHVTGFVPLPRYDEKALAMAVATKGPIAVAVDARLDSFRNYAGGIYRDSKCKNGTKDVNHAVLVVGYGERDGQKFWLVKNSYGPGWGIDGFIEIAKDDHNRCGIATSAFYPLV